VRGAAILYGVADAAAAGFTPTSGEVLGAGFGVLVGPDSPDLRQLSVLVEDCAFEDLLVRTGASEWECRANGACHARLS
jgi:hypothetical protein